MSSVGYTLLYTLSELWFTQFCNSVLLCTFLLVSSVSFFSFSAASVLEKKQSGFPVCFSAFVGKSRGFLSVFLY